MLGCGTGKKGERGDGVRKYGENGLERAAGDSKGREGEGKEKEEKGDAGKCEERKKGARMNGETRVEMLMACGKMWCSTKRGALIA